MSPRIRRIACPLVLLVLTACGGSPPEPVTATAVTSAPPITASALMPANSLGIMHVQLAVIRESQWFDRARRQLHEIMPREQMDRELRLAEDIFMAIDDLAMAMASREAEQTAVRTTPARQTPIGASLLGLVLPPEDMPERLPAAPPRGPEPFVGFAEGRITPAMVNSLIGRELTQTTRNGRPYWGDDEGAIIVLDESHAMMGLPPAQADALESRFDRESPATGPTNPELISVAERVEFGSHMFQFASLMTRDLRREFSRRHRDQLVSIGGYADLDDTFAGHLSIRTRSNETAAAMAAEFNAEIDELRQQPEFEMFGASSIIDHLRIATDGEYLTIDLALDQDQIEQVFQAVAAGIAMFQQATL